MDEGTFVLNTSTFGIMDLEADMSSSPDDLLYYLTDQSQDILPFDSTHLFDDFTSVPSLSASSSSSSPASSPPSSFSFSSSPGSGCSPISSPSSCVSPSNSSSGGSSPEGPRIDVEDHFVFGSWIESALGSTDAAPTISPSQLQMGSHHVSLDLTPQILALSPPPSSNDDDEESADSPPARRSAAGKKDTRKRKRTKKSSDEALPQTAVSLPRDELLKLSSQELEEYAENLRKVRKLTSEEEKDLRRQRRLIKNRESAQLSRVRRREHMEVLEQQLQEVQNENARLKLQVESLTTENLQLKQHIASSSSLVVPPRSPLLSANNASTETDEPSPSLIKMVQGWTTLGKGATATAVKATYLFVILLSIGLFFNARFVHYGPGLGPFEMGHRAVGMPSVYQFPAPESVRAAAVEVPPPPSSKLDSSSHFQRATRGHRDLLELSGDADSMEMADVVNPKKNVELIVSKKTNNNKIEPEQVYVDSEKVDMDVKWSRRDTLSSSAAFVHSSSSTTVSAMATGEYANKTILMCPTFSPVHWPGEEMSADAEEITFLLPASSASYIPASRLRTDYSSSSASSSFPATAKQASGNVVQLTCKIVDARMTSLSSLLVQ